LDDEGDDEKYVLEPEHKVTEVFAYLFEAVFFRQKTTAQQQWSSHKAQRGRLQ